MRAGGGIFLNTILAMRASQHRGGWRLGRILGLEQPPFVGEVNLGLAVALDSAAIL